MNTDKMTPDFWDDLAVGDVVQMKDEQALKDSLERGDGLNPINYIVGEIRVLEEQAGLATWKLIRLDDAGQQTIWLLLKIVDGLMDVRAYYTPDDEYTPVNRLDLISNGGEWFFDMTNPAIPVQDAMFAPQIGYAERHSDGRPDFNLDYVRKSSGTLTAEMYITPEPSGMDQPIMTLITEYNSNQECDNPELMILEVGDNDAGGLVELYLGAPLGETDFDVLKR